MTVYSEVGQGDDVQRFLPPGGVGESSRPSRPRACPSGRERILLVDDEEAQVQSIQNMLKRLGHRVVVKTDAEEALRSSGRNPARFDLVITDQTMPQADR